MDEELDQLAETPPEQGQVRSDKPDRHAQGVDESAPETLVEAQRADIALRGQPLPVSREQDALPHVIDACENHSQAI